MVTGKFEFADGGASKSSDEPPVAGGLGPSGINELLSGGIASTAPTASVQAERKRTQEVSRIIGLVEPAAPGAVAAPGKEKDCIVQ